MSAGDAERALLDTITRAAEAEARLSIETLMKPGNTWPTDAGMHNVHIGLSIYVPVEMVIAVSSERRAAKRESRRALPWWQRRRWGR